VPTISWQVDQQAIAGLAQHRFGKTILFTDRDAWTDEQIVLAYRAQSKIEDVFKLMKHPQFLRWQPQWCWTDAKVRVHAFCCVLAVTLSSLMQRQLARGGLHLNIPRILEELCGIHETTLLYPGATGRRPIVHHLVAQITPTQESIIRLLGLSTDNL